MAGRGNAARRHTGRHLVLSVHVLLDSRNREDLISGLGFAAGSVAKMCQAGSALLDCCLTGGAFLAPPSLIEDQPVGDDLGEMMKHLDPGRGIYSLRKE